MLLKERRHEGETRQAVVERVLGQVVAKEGAAGEECATPERANGSVVVHHGIHSGRFPVAGMTVAQARRTLAPLINIDPDAVAVINGYEVEDEATRTITSQDQLLSFVKRTSIRGAF